jgi:hypothetical protein
MGHKAVIGQARSLAAEPPHLVRVLLSFFQIEQWIDRLGADTNLEMEARLVDVSGHAGFGNRLAAADPIAALD